MQLKINDYDLAFSAAHGWAKVEIFGKEIRFDFMQTDAITAAIELGIVNQPDDRDDDRIGYEKPLFSATARESFDYAKRIQYQFNFEALRELSGTDFAEQVVKRLAWQQAEVKEIIQDNARQIILIECPVGMIEELQLKVWWSANKNIPLDCIDFTAISDYMKQSYYVAEQETLSQL